jgi:FAD/FMN-containing dehydrogenase
MKRRTFLASSLSAVTFAQGHLAFARKRTPDWASLKRKLGARLIDIQSPLKDCAQRGGVGAATLFRKLKNPFFLSDEPSLTQSLGWVDAWTSQPSVKAVAAETGADVAAAVDFARREGIAPVIKGGGHSYFGNSNRAGSLLIWTHRLRKIELHDGFRGRGWPAGIPPIPAVSIGAGCLWGEVYRKVSVEHGRYVQGGGCLTVGAAGLVQSGGFGSLSKQFGTGAANLLEAEIVTADGLLRTANSWLDPELFYAIRGGGGGTFGVVTQLTMRTHPLPSTIGDAQLEIRANSEASWRELVARMIAFYAANLFNSHWGEQIRFSRGRRLRIAMVSHGLSGTEMERVWSPLLHWVQARPADYAFSDAPQFLALPGQAAWDPAVLLKIPDAVLQDGRPGAPKENVYWKGNGEEAAQVIHAYQSAWIPAALLAPSKQAQLVDALVRASNFWGVTLHTNKGLAGGSPEALAGTRETATNPEVLDAFALLIAGMEEGPAYPGIPGREPDVVGARRNAAQVRAAMAEIYRIAPSAGSYVSESDYFLTDWKRAYWGSNYPRLAAAKQRYDPDWLFRGHHCVEPLKHPASMPPEAIIWG